MRIGHYAEGIWDPGGVSVYIRRITKAQRAVGHEVFTLDTRPQSRPDPETKEKPIVVQDDHALFARARELKLDILHLHGPVSVLPEDRVPTVRTLHTHSPYCPSDSRYLKRWGKPCDRAYSVLGCLWGHWIDHCGSIRLHRTWQNFQRIRLEQSILPHIFTITDSEFLKIQMIRNGYPASRITALRLPPPPHIKATLPPSSGIPRFVYLGRVDANKGVDWLIRAVARVTTPVHIDVVGDGPKLQSIQSLAVRLGVTKYLTFHGWVNGDGIVEFLRNCRALILPSLWHEPGATVAVEAMAAGRALIMSRVGGMTELILEGQNGLLVEPNDIPGLAQAIECLALDWDMAAKMGAKGRALVDEKYSLSKHMETLRALYHRVRQFHS